MLHSVPENPQTDMSKRLFHCEACDYSTSNRKDFKKHESTKKHENNQLSVTYASQKSPDPSDKICKFCNKGFKCRMSLWRHSKKCVKDESVGDFANKDAIWELIKQNKELQNVLVEQNNAIMDQNTKLIELSKQNALTQQTITNNTITNNNNQFNLNVFLNEQCKDAISFIDFVNSLQIQVKDLEKTGQLGYVEGISNIFLSGLRKLDVFTRPIHCTDLKRETVYVKDQDTWEKDNADKAKLKLAIQQVARRNLKNLPAWQEENPDFKTLDTKENNEFLKIALNALGGETEEEEDKLTEKIIKNVLKDVVVDKK